MALRQIFLLWELLCVAMLAASDVSPRGHVEGAARVKETQELLAAEATISKQQARVSRLRQDLERGATPVERATLERIVTTRPGLDSANLDILFAPQGPAGQPILGEALTPKAKAFISSLIQKAARDYCKPLGKELGAAIDSGTNDESTAGLRAHVRKAVSEALAEDGPPRAHASFPAQLGESKISAHLKAWSLQEIDAVVRRGCAALAATASTTTRRVT